MRLFFLHKLYSGYYAKIHSPSSIFWWNIIVWFPCQVWWTGFHYHSTCFNSWWNARCSCAWDYIEFTTLFVKSWFVLLFLWMCERLGENCWFVKCVFYFLNTWHVCMTGSLAGTGKSCFPCILCFVYWGVNHQKNTHIFHGSTMDMYGYVRISNLLDLFDVQVVRWVSTHLCRCFWCWLCKVDEIQGGGWQLEACKSFGTCQDWGPWPAIIFDYPSRSLTARPWKMMGLEDDPFLLGPGNFSGAMLNC